MRDHRTSEFIKRHIGPSQAEQTKMLDSVGYKSMEKFIKDIVLEHIRRRAIRYERFCIRTKSIRYFKRT